MELFEFSQVKALLDLEKDSIDDYPDLKLIADMVSASFESYLGWEFDEERRTLSLYQEQPTRLIALVGLPVKSITSLTINGSAFTDYRIMDYGLRLGSKVSDSDIECVYTGGLPEVPGWLNRCAIYQTCYEFQNKDHIGADYVATEGGSVGRPQLTLLKNVKDNLDPYVHPLTRFY